MKNKLKNLTKSEYYFLKSMCRNSKNVYNATLYQVRQSFFKGNYLSNYKLYHKIKKHHSYKSMPAQPARQSMNAVSSTFSSYFSLLKLKQNGKYNEKVNLPNYLDKDGYYDFIVPNANLNKSYGGWKNQIKIRIPTNLKSKYKLKEFTYPIPECIQQYKIKEIRIIPKLNGTYFEIAFIYEIQEKEESKETNNLSIDIGVNNFATNLNEQSGHSFILDGKSLKSLNRLYNKKKAYLQKILSKQNLTSSKRIRQMGYKRSNQIGEYLNQYVNFILQYCLENKIGYVIIGEGWLAQNGCNMSKQNNQNFVNLPFAKFANKLKFKFQLNGIKFDITEESYTSKCDHLAGETMEHHDKYLGKRQPRGLFKSSTGVTLNSDVNGCLGIFLKKGIGNDLRVKLSSGGINSPRRIRMNQIRQTSSKRLVKTLV